MRDCWQRGATGAEAEVTAPGPQRGRPIGRIVARRPAGSHQGKPSLRPSTARKAYAIGGIQKAQLKGGAPGKSAIQIQGKGADVGVLPSSAMPSTMLDATTAVQVQLQQGGGACYETSFLPAAVKTNSYADFRGTFQAGY